ncbi:hypothetical protein CPT_MarsHill_177 [Staphylococcus phage MarsHill]|nr:hypothetical protein CPT_MarsHill_177 [Staphylococcus phage MarsHill]QQO92826.1 hypothetical protein CPT_Madawaska_176 [Staphylococcus phage Madawaska]
MLDLFEGRLSFNEILNMELNILNSMVKAKEKEMKNKRMQQQKLESAQKRDFNNGMPKVELPRHLN